MTTPDKILVSTTSSLDGVNIKQYLKNVSAHVVAGTNFFSDFFASFNDFFGGRSNSYQKELSSIYNEAIELLKQSAYEIGANCILGLKVDLDEISGKGKSMFMITATGTAVIVENLNTENKGIDIINAYSMSELRECKKVINELKQNNASLTERIWQIIIKNSISEVAQEVLDKIQEQLSPYEWDKKLYQNLCKYFSVLPEDIRTKILYENLMNDNPKDKDGLMINVIYKLINDLMVFDYHKLKEYLNSEENIIKTKALQICLVEKNYYSKDDIKIYEDLINSIKINFVEIGQISTKKKVFSSTEKEIWICSCGTKNDIDDKFCHKCNKDIYGFLENQINPTKAISYLSETIEIIKATIK